MPKISPDVKLLIINNLKSKGPAEVATTFNVSKRQVERIRERYRETGEVHDKPRSGRPRKTTPREDKMLVRQSKAHPFCTSKELQQSWTPSNPVSSRTVRRILDRNGLKGCIAAQKPSLNKRQLKKRVEFANAHSPQNGWIAEKWKKVDFSDESSIELHPKRRQCCHQLCRYFWHHHT